MAHLTLVPRNITTQDYYYDEEISKNSYCLYRFYTKRNPVNFVCVREVAVMILSEEAKEPLKSALKSKPKKFFYKTFVTCQPNINLALTFNMALIVENCCHDDVTIVNEERLSNPEKHVDFVGHASTMMQEWIKHGGVFVYAPQPWFDKFELNLKNITRHLEHASRINL
jgi:hypothetical protein